MSDYLVKFAINGEIVDSVRIKIKHFRQYDGRDVSTHGGHTAIFNLRDGVVFSSKCRGNEQFSRHKGLLTCLQKMCQSKYFPFITRNINEAHVRENEMLIQLVEKTPERGLNWWLAN